MYSLTGSFTRLRRDAVGAGLIAAALVLLVTSDQGPGLDPDALAYTGAASSLVQHGTLRVPTASWWDRDSTSALSRWPPGFSAALAVPMALGAPPRTAERIVLALSAFVTASLLFVVLSAGAGRAAGWLGVVAAFATPAILWVHLSVLSEPLFLASLLLTLWTMLRAKEIPALLGLAAAAVMMVRYAGACAPLAVVLWYLLDRNAPTRAKVINAAKAAAVPTIALAAWAIRVRRLSAGHSGLQFKLYGNFGPTIAQARGTIATWLAPSLSGIFQALALVMVVAAMALLLYLGSRRADEAPRSEVTRAAGLLLGCYLLILALARLFAGGTIPFDFRLLAPGILLAELLIILSASRAISYAGRSGRVAIAALFALWIAGSIAVDLPVVRDGLSDGLDFAGSDWRLSDTVDWVKSDGAGRALFSNWPPAIYFHAHRIARDLPESLDCDDLRLFRQILERNRGALVAFKEPSPDYPAPDSIARLMSLREEVRLSDGIIWTATGAPPMSCGMRRQ